MDKNQIEKSLWAFDRTTRTHAQVLQKHRDEIVAVEKRAAAKITRLEKALAVEKAERAAIERKHYLMIAEAEAVDRVAAADTARVERSVEGLDQALGETIRKVHGPRPPSTQTIVRDADGRITEIITTEDGADFSTVKRIIRWDFRVVGAETYTVPHEDES